MRFLLSTLIFSFSFSLIYGASFKGDFKSPRYIRVGKLEIPATQLSWDEFKSTSTSPLYEVGRDNGKQLVQWIGQGATPGVTQSQRFLYAGLKAGEMYGLKLYGSYATAPSYLHAQIRGARLQNSADNYFAFAYEAAYTPWTLVFIAEQTQVEIEVSFASPSRNHYVYVDAWEFIQFPSSVPKNQFVWSSSQGPYLLGAPSGSQIKQSPLYKIRYQDYGYNPPLESSLFESRLNTLYSARRWLMSSIRIPEQVISQYEDLANSILLRKDSVGKWIDDSTTVIKSKWAACGGRYLTIAGGVNLQSVRVTIRPSFWWEGNSNLGAVWASGSQSGYQINAAVLTIPRMYSDPTNAYLMRGERFIEWELGNLFRALYGNGPIAKDAYGETGNLSPCGRN